jgi:small subunit ribosomal protein S6
MAKTTAKYETVFIVDAQLGEEGAAAVIERFKTLIAENATIGDVEEWGKRRFAYPINDLMEGYYCLIHFEAAPAFPAELERVYNITEGLLRSLTICKDEA